MIFSPMASRRDLSSSFLLIDKKQMRELRLKKKPLLIIILLVVAASACIAVVLCNSSGFLRPTTSDAVVSPHAYNNNNNSNTKNDDVDIDIGDDDNDNNNKGSVVLIATTRSTASDSTAIFKECRPDDLGVSGCGAGAENGTRNNDYPSRLPTTTQQR